MGDPRVVVNSAIKASSVEPEELIVSASQKPLTAFESQNRLFFKKENIGT